MFFSSFDIFLSKYFLKFLIFIYKTLFLLEDTEYNNDISHHNLQICCSYASYSYNHNDKIIVRINSKDDYSKTFVNLWRKSK